MISLEQTGGIGRNASYRIFKDSKHVASMGRDGNWGWRVWSVHYAHNLAAFKTIERAREGLGRVTYPSKHEVYEAICERTSHARRKYKEKLHAHDLARLARALVDGSNSAREEIEALVREIETWIYDRAHTGAFWSAHNQRHFEETGERIYTPHSDVPLYPDAP